MEKENAPAGKEIALADPRERRSRSATARVFLPSWRTAPPHPTPLLTPHPTTVLRPTPPPSPASYHRFAPRPTPPRSPTPRPTAPPRLTVPTPTHRSAPTPPTVPSLRSPIQWQPMPPTCGATLAVTPQSTFGEQAARRRRGIPPTPPPLSPTRRYHPLPPITSPLARPPARFSQPIPPSPLARQPTCPPPTRPPAPPAPPARHPTRVPPPRRRLSDAGASTKGLNHSALLARLAALAPTLARAAGPPGAVPRRPQPVYIASNRPSQVSGRRGHFIFWPEHLLSPRLRERRPRMPATPSARQKGSSFPPPPSRAGEPNTRFSSRRAKKKTPSPLPWQVAALLPLMRQALGAEFHLWCWSDVAPEVFSQPLKGCVLRFHVWGLACLIGASRSPCHRVCAALPLRWGLKCFVRMAHPYRTPHHAPAAHAAELFHALVRRGVTRHSLSRRVPFCGR